MTPQIIPNIEQWPIDHLVECSRNPRKNDGAVDRMVASIREFGFKIRVLARSDGEVVDTRYGGSDPSCAPIQNEPTSNGSKECFLRLMVKHRIARLEKRAAIQRAPGMRFHH